MIPQDTPPAPAEVCERLREAADALHHEAELSFHIKAMQLHRHAHNITAALLLIEQGEKERERISKAFDLLLNAIPQKAVKHLDMGNLMAAVKLVPGCLILPDAARAQPTPESKSAQRGEEQP